MNETIIKIAKKSQFETKNICGYDHLYYDFNKIKYNRNILVFLNLHEHYNNLELFKFALLCKKYDTKLTVYTHINEFPLVSTFADSAILYLGGTDEIYRNITKYEHDDRITGCLFNKFLHSPHGLNDAVALSRTGSENWPLLLEIADKQISDEDVVLNFHSPEIHIMESSYEKFIYLDKLGDLKDNLIVCEVKVAEEKFLEYDTGEILLNTLKESSKKITIEVVTELEKNKKIADFCKQDYMGVQILCSFIKNWMWVCYGGSSNIFPFFPVKILSLSDQTLCKDLIRKISVKRFGEIGNVLPEFENLIYCLPGERDGPSRTDGHPPLPNLQKSSIDFLNQKLNFKIIF